MKLDARRCRQRELTDGQPGHGGGYDRVSQTAARVIEEPTDGPAFCDPTFVVEPSGELSGVTVFIGPSEENGDIVLVVETAAVAF